MRPGDISRRDFLRSAAAAGIAASILPLDKALADLQTSVVSQPPNWLSGTNVRFRRDGIPKVAGDKVFAIDIRARDMPGWPDEQAHGLLLRVARADRIFEDIDLSFLDEDLRPDVVVTSDELERDGITMPEEDFYGPLLLTKGETPVFLGQPVALLIYHDYPRFRLAKRRFQFNQDAIKYGRETGYTERDPYGGARYVRVGGPTPDDEDVFSPLKNATVFARIANRTTEWPGSCF